MNRQKKQPFDYFSSNYLLLSSNTEIYVYNTDFINLLRCLKINDYRKVNNIVDIKASTNHELAVLDDYKTLLIFDLKPEFQLKQTIERNNFRIFISWLSNEFSS